MKRFFIALVISLFQTITAIGQSANFSFEPKVLPRPSEIDSIVLNHLIRQKEYSRLADSAKQFLYWTNYSRINPKRFWDSVVLLYLSAYPALKGSYSESLKKDLYNKQKGLPLFVQDPGLNKLAQAHAEDITNHKARPAHHSTNGDSFSKRFREAGFLSCGGENLSYGAIDPLFSLVLLYIDAGIPSVGHRKTLLDEHFTFIGIGYADFEQGNHLYVQDFACP
jgi:hypothetical protein